MSARRSPMWRLRTGRRVAPPVLALIVALTLTTACSSVPGLGSSSGTDSSGAAPGALPAESGPPDPQKVAEYGYGPVKGPAYLKDVVLIGGGPSAIKSSGPDGFTYVFDHRATGVDKLKVGDVAFASAMAVGRVVQISPAGTDRTAVLMPVPLDEIVKDATFDLHNYPIDFATATVTDTGLEAMKASNDPGPMSELLMPSGAEASARPSSFHTARASAQPRLASADDDEAKWEVHPFRNVTGIGVEVVRSSGNLLLNSKLTLLTSAPLLSMSGQPGSDEFQGKLDGIQGLGLDITAGFGDADPSLAKGLTIAWPSKSLTVQIPPGPETFGIPLVVSLSFKALVALNFASRNSSLEAIGEYSFDRGFAFQGPSGVGPEATVTTSLLDSMVGLSVGGGSVVTALKIQFSAGVGVKAFNAGPYVSVTTSFGLAIGSAITPYVMCQMATLNIWGGAGVGYTITPEVLKTVAETSKSSILGWIAKKLEKNEEKDIGQKDRGILLFHAQQSRPNGEMCQVPDT